MKWARLRVDLRHTERLATVASFRTWRGSRASVAQSPKSDNCSPLPSHHDEPLLHRMVTRTVSPSSTFFLPAFAKPNAALADIRDSRYTLDLNCPIGYQSIEQIMEGTKDAWPEDGLCCKLPTACVSDKFIVRPLFVKTEREETMKTKSKSIVLAVWAMTALLAGCQSGNQPTTEQPAEQPATTQAGAAKSGAPKRRPASTEARGTGAKLSAP